MIKKLFLSIIFLLASASLSHALLIDLVHEFDGNSDGLTSFGTVNIIENSGVLNFTISANTTNLGSSEADIHEFYFNLLPSVTGLSTSGSNPTPGNPTSSPSVTGGAGASFDYGINFGNGGTKYQSVTFSLFADQSLSLADLYEWSSPNNTPQVLMAVHFQSTNAFPSILENDEYADSETVGGGVAPVPEPATMLLFGVGLIGLVGSKFRKAND